jgi:uncharacterized protein (DUF1778 family)
METLPLVSRRKPARPRATTRTARREARFEFRLSAQARERIQKAAMLNGQSLSDFAASVLLREADALIERHALRTLSEDEWQRFVALLQKPAKPNKALKAAAARYRKGQVAGDEYSTGVGGT